MLNVKDGTYGIFTTLKGVHTGYIAFYYTAATQEFIQQIVTKSVSNIQIAKPVDFKYATTVNTPKEGYLLISPEGVIKGISDIQDYQQKRLKSEVRKAYAEIAKQLENMLKTYIEYQNRLAAQRMLLQSLEADQKHSFAVANENIRVLKADLKAVLQNKVTLNQIVRLVREQKPVTSISKAPIVSTRENAILITSTGIIDNEGLDNKTLLANAHQKYNVDISHFPKHIGRMRVCVEEQLFDMSQAYIGYKHNIAIYYPCDLSQADVQMTMMILKTLGLIA